MSQSVMNLVGQLGGRKEREDELEKDPEANLKTLSPQIYK